MMLAITRALIVRPRFILFDEPSAGLSPRLAAEALARVAALAKRGVGVLMVEQNIREAMRVADRIYVLVGGRNRFEGVPADIRSGRQLMELYLGAPATQDSP
jgi:branched-chain amino acid transport system ATP-binding protein